MPETINTFIKGMDKDLSNAVPLDKSYRNAINWRLITNEGKSSASLENVKGNRLFFSIPSTSPVTTISVNLGLLGFHGNNDQITLTVGTITQTNTIILHIDPASTGETQDSSIYRNIIVTRINSATAFDSGGNIIANPLIPYSIIAVQSGANNIVIYSTNPLITSISVPIGAFHSTLVSAQPAQTNLRIIGWTIINDDFILITCSQNNPVTGGPGQIWRLSYTPHTIGTTFSTTLTLLYNNAVNLTQEHPIPSLGAIIGRYETIDIQRIYWTDNFNPVRGFNTVDPFAFGLNPDLLNLSPISESSVPVLNNINTGGILPAGIYQYAYRLISSGQETLFSNLSNIIPITDIDENDGNTDVRNYDGIAAGTVTGKRIHISIRGLDVDFDTVQIISVHRRNTLDVPVILIIREEAVPSSGEIKFIHTGNELATSLTLEEFTLLTRAFTHCKSLSEKDNRLFPANVRNERLNIAYDARVRRYNASGNTYSIGTLPDTNDDINTDPETFKYQSDGATIGGTGTNISYRILPSGHPLPVFANRSFRQDSRDDNPGGVVPHRLPDRSSSNKNIGVTNQDYYQQWFFENYMSPYYHGLFKGFQKREIYRTGIVFYDRFGVPDFVRWMGDIKMPGIHDGVNLFAPMGTADFTVGDGLEYYTHPLSLRFTVNIDSSIRSRISGFSIVRVQRGQNDRTIVTQGYLGRVNHSNISALTPTSNILLPSTLVSNDGFGSSPMGPIGGLTSLPTTYVRGFFPENFFGSMDYRAGDRLECLGAILETDRRNYPTVGGAGLDIVVRKYYTPSWQRPRMGSCDVLYGTFSPQGAISQNINSGTFTNRIPGTTDVVRGQSCFLMQLGNFLDFNGNSISNMFNELPGVPVGSTYIFNYVRNNANQYGGNSVRQRSLNQYMSCGHFQPVNDNSPLSFTFDVFGGDIFMPVWDFQERLKNGVTTASDINSHQNIFAPVESQLDIDMRTGVSANRNDITGFGGNVDESNIIEPHYNLENDVKRYIVRPFGFSLVEEFNNRVHASQIKFNGEQIDQWALFPVADFMDVDGIYGPINNLVKIGEEMIFLQDRAFGKLSINPRVLLQNITGEDLQLGTGRVLEDFNYLSTEAGCRHQWGMVIAGQALLFFDIYKKKLWKYDNEGIMPVSDVGGFMSYFANNLQGLIQTRDNPLTTAGITTTYDNHFSDALFTFKDSIASINGNHQNIDQISSLITNLPEWLVQQLSVGITIRVSFFNPLTNTVGEFTLVIMGKDETTLTIGSGLTFLPNGHLMTLTGRAQNNVLPLVFLPFAFSFTVSYNILLKEFTSFYSFTPSLYLNDKRVIITPNPANEAASFIHNYGDYGEFYGIKYPSSLELLINPLPVATKVFDNLQWHSVAIDASGRDILITFGILRCRTDAQDSSVQTLIATAIRNKERNWNVPVPRNLTRERMRDKYMTVNFSFVNTNNIKIVMNWLKTTFKISSR